MSGHRRLAALALAAAPLLPMATINAAPADAMVASPAALPTRPTRHQLHLTHLHRLHLLHLRTLHVLHLRTLASRRRQATAVSRTWVRNSLRSQVVRTAELYKGQPYSYGNLDCSGLTQRAYRAVGTSLPRTAAGQQRVGRHVRTPSPGDLVFYGNPAYHVAIYIRKGWMIVARHTGTVVQEQKIWGSPTYGSVLA